jgi:hypothetical protein
VTGTTALIHLLRLAGNDWEMLCACPVFGGPHTAIGSFLSLAAADQRWYWPYAPPFVQRAYPEWSGQHCETPSPRE